jgi:hypothetical protein
LSRAVPPVEAAEYAELGDRTNIGFTIPIAEVVPNLAVVVHEYIYRRTFAVSLDHLPADQGIVRFTG